MQALPDGSPAVAFMRLNRGDKPTDHHTLALAQTFAPALNHISFELIDPDAVGIGARLLRDRGWKHAWGMGRHLLGSQIFDYWDDPWGDKHEHYCDGDLFTADQPTGVHPASRAGMAQWGQVMPASFTRPKPTLSNMKALVHGLRSKSRRQPEEAAHAHEAVWLVSALAEVDVVRFPSTRDSSCL